MTVDLDLLARFQAELDALEKQGPVTLEMDCTTAWILLSHLQLALRHPANTGLSAMLGRDLARSLRDRIAPSGALREVFDKGWNPAFDMEVLNVADTLRSPGGDGHDVPPGPAVPVVARECHPAEDPRPNGVRSGGPDASRAGKEEP